MDLAGPISLTALGLLIVGGVVLGPVFCGKLCPAGALTEYLSYLVPRRFQIDWGRHLPVRTLRYGFFAGFLLAGLAGIEEHCSYCNFGVFDTLIRSVVNGRLPYYSLSLLVNFLVWFVLLGLFTRGGRGYCSFFCPVGALNNLLHGLGRRLPFAFRLRLDQHKCVGCGQCSRVCHMGAMEMTGKQVKIDPYRCILCQDCQAVCPREAISYGKGELKDGDA